MPFIIVDASPFNPLPAQLQAVSSLSGNRDLLNDPLTNDWKFVSGDVPFVGGAASIVQDAKKTLQTFMGEWYLDTTFGVPYFQKIFVKGTSQSKVEKILTALLLTVVGILRVDFLELTLDAPNRFASVKWSAFSTLGPLNNQVTVISPAPLPLPADS